ncbi:hypothetical protein GBA52_029023 [Prunus armeniaca]|nr:hypothetical protein GBA52_029023 [Prunus armeniaca]
MLDEVRRGGSEINGSVTALLIIHGFCQASRVSEAFWVLDELRSRQCKPDFMAYRIVAEAFRSTGSVVDVEKVLKKKRKLGVAPRTNDYRQFIFDLISERRICEAKELGEVIISGNFPIDDDVLNVLIGSVSAIDPTSAVVEDLLRPAKRLWDEMFASGCRGNLKTYNILIRKFSESGSGLCQETKLQAAFDVFHKSVEQDFMLAQNVLGTFTRSLCKAADAKEIPVAIEHVNWVRQTSPLMLQIVSAEL